MGQYADQFILDSYYYIVEDVMEVLLDIALTVLGTLVQRHQTSKALGRLHSPKEIALVAVDSNLAHLQILLLKTSLPSSRYLRFKASTIS